MLSSSSKEWVDIEESQQESNPTIHKRRKENFGKEVKRGTWSYIDIIPPAQVQAPEPTIVMHVCVCSSASLTWQTQLQTRSTRQPHSLAPSQCNPSDSNSRAKSQDPIPVARNRDLRSCPRPHVGHGMFSPLPVLHQTYLRLLWCG